MNHASLIALAAGGALISLPVAAADTDMQTLRAEIAQMRQAYESRIAALEDRLKQTEHVSTDAHATAVSAATPAARQGEGEANALNLEIGLVLQGRVKNMQDVPERAISGYWPAGHQHDGNKRGLSLGHSELMLAANIDPNFRGVARFVVTGDGEVEVEEASVATLGLGSGLAVRGGRFASEIGYQNAQHPDELDFADTSLMQKVLFGDEGYRHDGAQFKWIAPTDLLLQLGAEIGRGANYPGTDRNKNGVGAGALFAKFGGDVGASYSWQAGLSWLHTRAQKRGAHFEDTGGVEAESFFSGQSRTAIADFVWKWAPDGNATDRSLKLQTEVFRRTEKGTWRCDDADSANPTTCTGGAALGDLATRQSGGYAQAIYQFMPKWRVGYRYDWLGKGSKSFDAATVFGKLDASNHYFADFKPRRDSMMLDWSNSEFSRLRLQFARDRSMQGLTDKQVTLQYVMHLGAHDPH